MPSRCTPINMGDGTWGFLRTSGGGSGSLCEVCRERQHTRLCDFELGGGATCDKKLCDQCTHVCPDNRKYDLCPDHRPPGEKHHPRSRAAEYKWMKSIYAGACYICDERFPVGTKILWLKKARKALCEFCGQKVLLDAKPKTTPKEKE